MKMSSRFFIVFFDKGNERLRIVNFKLRILIRNFGNPKSAIEVSIL